MLTPDRGDAATERLATGISSEASRALGSPVRTAYSSPRIYPAGLPDMFAEVMETATVAEAHRHGAPTVQMTDISDQILLSAIDDLVASRPNLASTPVVRLLEQDERT